MRFVVDRVAPGSFSSNFDFTQFLIMSQMSHIHLPILGMDSGRREVAAMGDRFTHPKINRGSSRGCCDDADYYYVVVSVLVWSNYSDMGRPGFFSGVDSLYRKLCLHVLTPASTAVFKH
jgi:hypothetical protein